MKRTLFLLIIIPALLLFLSACNSNSSKSTDIEISEYIDPFLNAGSENYEVKVVMPPNYDSYYFKENFINGGIFILKAIESESKLYRSRRKLGLNSYDLLRLDKFGNTTGVLEGSNTIKKDGTILENNHYSNWVIDNDSTKYSYDKPEIRDREAPKNFNSQFSKLYNNATNVYYDYQSVYFKKNKNWIKLPDDENSINDSLKKVSPEIKGRDRMKRIEDVHAYYLTNPHQKNEASLVDFGFTVDYYNDKIYYITIMTPYREEIKIKWPGEFELYQISKGINSRTDVLFLRSFERNGMLAIGPKDSLQPEVKYNNVTFKSKNKKQYLDKFQISEAYQKWASEKQNNQK
ncbi:MAG: hypothetical protein ACTIJ9_16430 [Aequorivita sp.]